MPIEIDDRRLVEGVKVIVTYPGEEPVRGTVIKINYRESMIMVQTQDGEIITPLAFYAEFIEDGEDAKDQNGPTADMQPDR